MPSRALRGVVAVSVLSMFFGASVSQAAPGASGSAPGQVISGRLLVVHADPLDQDVEEGSQGGEEKAAKPYLHPFGAVPDHVLPGLQYWLEDEAGQHVLLEFPGTPPPAISGQQVSARGERHGRVFHVSQWNDDPEVAAAKGGGGGSGGGKPTKPSPSSPSFIGERDMIVIPITFQGNSTPLLSTRDQIRERGFVGARSVKTYYEEGSATTAPYKPLILKGKSDGTTADPDLLPGDVTPIYDVKVNTDTCDYRGWATAARAAATADGWDLTGYEHVVYLHPRLFTLDTDEGDIPPDEVPLCNYGGLATIGGTESWLNGTISLGTWAHELGHNLTLYHSRTLICRSGTVFIAVGGTCTYDEYGDPFDVMGSSSNLRHYHARNKAHMGWFPAANVKAVTASGEYLVHPIETAVAAPQVLQIPRGREYLYVDVRKISGQYDNYPAGDDALTGALIRSGPAPASNGNSYLFDTAIYPTRTVTYEDATGADVSEVVPDFRDAALQVGQGFVDTTSGVYIEPLGFEGDALRVLVRLGVTNTAPVVSPGETSSTVLPGQPVQHQGASATDVNKNLGMYRWEFTSCPGTCPRMTGAEGALSSGSSSIPGAVFTPVDSGTYVLSLTVWDTAGPATTVQIEKRAGL